MRLIEDFSVCGVNATVGLPEKLRVESVDQVVAIILSMMHAKQALRRLPWTGRTFDLKAAYKQFGVSLDESNRLGIAIKSGQNDVSFYNVLPLPFGATGSVVAFLRIAAALAFIGTRGLLICWSSFFDDFTAIAPENVAGNTQYHLVNCKMLDPRLRRSRDFGFQKEVSCHQVCGCARLHGGQNHWAMIRVPWQRSCTIFPEPSSSLSPPGPSRTSLCFCL